MTSEGELWKRQRYMSSRLTPRHHRVRGIIGRRMTAPERWERSRGRASR